MVETKNSQSRWWVYMIEADDGSFYTGVTTDIRRRFREHLGLRSRGARYFRGRSPWGVVFLEAQEERSSALRREAAIKKLGKLAKSELKQAVIVIP